MKPWNRYLMMLSRPPCTGSGPPATSVHFHPVASQIMSRIGWAKQTNLWMHLNQVSYTLKWNINRNLPLVIFWSSWRAAFKIILLFCHCHFMLLLCLFYPLCFLLWWKDIVHILCYFVLNRSMLWQRDIIFFNDFLCFCIDSFAL